MSYFKHAKMTGGGEHDVQIDLKPFINFLVVLIPVLMLSAEFAKISIINLKLPEGRGSQTAAPTTRAPLDDESDKLLLTMIITDSVVTLGAKSSFLPSLFYKEYHKYVSREDRKNEVIVEYDPRNPNKEVLNKKTNKPFDLNERQEILLYLTDEKFENIVKCLYGESGEMLVSLEGKPLESVNTGDTVIAIGSEQVVTIVKDKTKYQLRPVSAYDEMKSRLMRVKERFKDVRDAEEIIIASENQVAYDKIVQLMDVARIAGFPNISISKLRS
jgi:biopolymer transport protein ExbD